METKQSYQDTPTLPADTSISRDDAMMEAVTELCAARRAYDELILGVIICSPDRDPDVQVSIDERIRDCKDREAAAKSEYDTIFSGRSHFTPGGST